MAKQEIKQPTLPKVAHEAVGLGQGVLPNSTWFEWRKPPTQSHTDAPMAMRPVDLLAEFVLTLRTQTIESQLRWFSNGRRSRFGGCTFAYGTSTVIYWRYTVYIPTLHRTRPTHIQSKLAERPYTRGERKDYFAEMCPSMKAW